MLEDTTPKAHSLTTATTSTLSYDCYFAGMAIPPVQLYAELLANIRQVSVSAIFGGPVDNARTTAAVLSDGQTLRIQHDGRTSATMKLPGRVASVDQEKELPIQGATLVSGNVTWRLPVAAVEDNYHKIVDDSLAPWSAPGLPTKARIACRACDTEIVAANTIQTWKDLPSDNWAEMMEFWHCHKPDTKKPDTEGDDKADAQDRLADRGYGANGGLSAAKGVAFVDLTTLLLPEDDCQRLLVSNIFSFFFFGHQEGGQAGHTGLDSMILTDTTAPENLFCSCYLCFSINFWPPCFSPKHGHEVVEKTLVIMINPCHQSTRAHPSFMVVHDISTRHIFYFQMFNFGPSSTTNVNSFQARLPKRPPWTAMRCCRLPPPISVACTSTAHPAVPRRAT